ncbi:MAG: DUF2157 domain-containing protein [Magnetococcales bacterium]|nr:DUF2157 domain-containing protein [Magnetococcales bacterium]
MNRLSAQLQTWVENGLINPAQAEAITAFEAGRPGVSRLMQGLIGVGVLALGNGLIALIAANWEAIPPGIKLTSAFAFLLALALGLAMRHTPSPSRWWEGGLHLFALALLATLGLITQIYHSQGTLAQFMLFWCLISLPPVLLSRRGPLANSWVAAFFVSLLWWISGIDDSLGSDALRRLVAVVFALPMVSLALARLLESTPWATTLVRPLRFWSLVLAYLSLNALGFFGEERLLPGALLEYLLPGLLIGGLLLTLSFFRPLMEASLLPLSRALLGFYLFFFTLASWTPLNHWVVTLFHLILLSLFALISARQGETRRVSVATGLMGLHLFAVYLRAAGGLVQTGFGLIVTGAVILSLLFLWQRFHTRWRRLLPEKGP